MNVALLHHGPEVVDGVGQGALGGDVEPLALAHRGGDVAGVDVPALVVLVCQNLHSVLVIRHDIFEPGAKIFQQSGIYF